MARSKIPQPYADRLKAVRSAMAKRKLGAYLVQNASDQTWLTGFTGEDGAVLVTANSVILLTDGRFDETANREAPWAQKVLRKIRGPEATAKEVTKRRAARVGFDARHMLVHEHTALRKLIKPARLVAVSNPIAPLRGRKDAQEVAAIQRAIDVAQKAFTTVARTIKPGQLEREIAARLIYEMQKRGASGPSFPPIVAAGPNAALPHYAPGDGEVRADQPLLIDWGARVVGYCSDLTRIVWLASIPNPWRKVYDAVRDAHDAAIDAIRPGMAAAEVDGAARTVIRKAGYAKQFTHALGHGLGLDVHEAPRVAGNSQDTLEPGMVVTIEPGIYLPGKGGIRLESDVLITDHGCDVLTNLPM